MARLTLGFSEGILTIGISNHLRRLDKDERRLLTRSRPATRHSHNNPLILSQGDGFEWRKTEVHTTAITESGLYKLIMRSDKDTAKPFQDWVTRDVLPAIRKTGGYLLNEHARETAHADQRTEMPLPQRFRLTLTLGEREPRPRSDVVGSP